MLNVARKKIRCKVLGPGERNVIWFHGCARHCPGCIAHTMNETAEYETVTPQQLAGWVLTTVRSESQKIEGLTLSGGDPLFQPADELAEFLKLVKDNSDLSILCYTGDTYEDIVTDAQKSAVLQYIDVLIDGVYKQEEDLGQRWRGSANQRFIFLTDRYKNQADEWNAAQERQVEIELDMNGKVLIAGVPSKGFIRKLTERVEQHGIDLDFS